MFLNQFINDFSILGSRLSCLYRGSSSCPEWDCLMDEAYGSNPFFTKFMQQNAIKCILERFLNERELRRWLGNYDISPEKNIGRVKAGIIMAGNLPLVGFHDFLCVLATGADCYIKLSSKDPVLLPGIIGMLADINPFWQERIHIVNRNQMEIFHDMDALISTGSDFTAAAVADEYKEIPTLLRGKRFSFAVLESDSEKALNGLDRDIFLYYGLGCRSISYLLLMRNVSINRVAGYLMGSEWVKESGVAGDANYKEIYRRNRALYGMEKREYIDGGFFIISRTEDVEVPVGIVGYEYIDSENDICRFENKFRGNIQKKFRTFGIAQVPAIDDYADGIDTMRFLLDNLQ